MSYKTTIELLQLLKNKRFFSDVLKEGKSGMTNPQFSLYLYELLEKYECSIPKLIEYAQISRSFGYQLANGTRIPGRNIILRIVLGMKFTVGEAQQLLKLAQKGELYPRVRRDAAILFCIEHSKGLWEAEMLLEELKEESLYKDDVK